MFLYNKDVSKRIRTTFIRGAYYTILYVCNLRIFGIQLFQEISKDTHIVAANSVSLPATRVLIEALRHLKYLILEELTERCSEALSSESISWILTVPALWTKSTRQLIKEIAIEVSENHFVFTVV